MIAACGLYCGACRKYGAGKCPGCRETTRAKWCAIRTCCRQKGLSCCAECEEELSHCKKFNNFATRVIGWLLGSDRTACIRSIRQEGPAVYAARMAQEGRHTLKKGEDLTV